MQEFEKIAILENDFEALLLEERLKQAEIPHMMRSYHDQAYDGLFQTQKGWGEVRAAPESRDEVLVLLRDIRESADEASSNEDED